MNQSLLTQLQARPFSSLFAHGHLLLPQLVQRCETVCPHGGDAPLCVVSLECLIHGDVVIITPQPMGIATYAALTVENPQPATTSGKLSVSSS